MNELKAKDKLYFSPYYQSFYHSTWKQNHCVLVILYRIYRVSSDIVI